MGVPISNYTGTDAIRGALGLTDNEVTDAMLVDQRLDLELSVDLELWVPTHASVYTAGIAYGATPTEVLKANYLLLYAQWFCALHVTKFMRLAIPQMVGDGKAEMRRFQAFDLDQLEATANSRAIYYKSLLYAATGGAAAATTVSFASVGVPDYDPVVGP